MVHIFSFPLRHRWGHGRSCLRATGARATASPQPPEMPEKLGEKGRMEGKEKTAKEGEKTCSHPEKIYRSAASSENKSWQRPWGKWSTASFASTVEPLLMNCHLSCHFHALPCQFQPPSIVLTQGLWNQTFSTHCKGRKCLRSKGFKITPPACYTDSDSGVFSSLLVLRVRQCQSTRSLALVADGLSN